ncbi:PAS-like protein [Cordyceps fumosorosea ARSEF 2679]|uniref:PAS-like protein n=1 Tax=Cordyceps fumosorosea (strain ARSEF 2679) TaxID=1081104 RepID=A0A162JTS2_CORFA|nr:PAS-like protein [Cordyceps fumosorosea ARSEF 2679]OAA73682.1 PAS-like protein [Cordyceps fumosorosea ARSEF 2679]
MDQTVALDAVPPLSPVSSQSSNRSIEEIDAHTSAQPPPSLLQDSYHHHHHHHNPGSRKPASLPQDNEDGEGAELLLLPALQVANGDPDGLDPIAEDDLVPGSFDLVTPGDQPDGGGAEGTTAPAPVASKHRLERRSELLFSRHHLHAIFADAAHLHRFTNYMHKHRPASVALLGYYLGALKALRAIDYSNAVLRQQQRAAALPGLEEFTAELEGTDNGELRDRAAAAFEALVREELPAYVTHVWIQTVSVSIRHRVMGGGADSGGSEGLAEVFCLTDPSRTDNPIVFMSEQFNRTTQYGVDYVIGRNCRFLQGPCTNPFSVRRIREKLEAGVEHYETFLNYRRDGTPFMNLVMLAPLYDSRGAIRYFIGAQVDVSGLAMSSYDLNALRGLVEENGELDADAPLRESPKDEITQLAEILTPKELDVIGTHGGSMHRLPLQDAEDEQPTAAATAAAEKREYEPSHYRRGTKERVIIQDSGSQESLPMPGGGSSSQPMTAATLRHNGRLTGVYEHYLLVRPYPSLRILFASPSMRVPGILQSPLLDRIGGSSRVREQLVDALAAGQGVTAKVKWLNASRRRTAGAARKKKPTTSSLSHPLEAHLQADDDGDTLSELEPAGRSRWLHCTPLSGANNKVGVWMMVIVDEEDWNSRRYGVVAPPVPAPTPTQHQRPETATSAPGTAVSGVSFAMGSETAAAAASGVRTEARPRRSSETLGYLRSEFALPPQSSTQAIHNQHAASSARERAAPRSLFGNGSGAASRFFSSEALSRAATPPPKHRPASPPGSGIPSGLYRVFPRSEPPLPPWPTRSDSKTRGGGGGQAAEGGSSKQRVVSMIPEEGYERYTGEMVRRRREDDETSSLHSQGSAFTVRIGED